MLAGQRPQRTSMSHCNGTLPKRLSASQLREYPKGDVMKSMGRVFLILTVLLPVTMFVSSASWAQTKLEASIFTYDGKDFVRTNTTLMDKGQSAVGTKLDQSGAAYKALIEKHSYTGPATVFGRDVFGRDYDADYAGKLTGTLFVGVPK
jgi:hypothetical protein